MIFGEHGFGEFAFTETALGASDMTPFVDPSGTTFDVSTEAGP